MKCYAPGLQHVAHDSNVATQGGASNNDPGRGRNGQQWKPEALRACDGH